MNSWIPVLVVVAAAVVIVSVVAGAVIGLVLHQLLVR